MNEISSNASHRLGQVAGHVSGTPFTISVGGMKLSVSFDGQSAPVESAPPSESVSAVAPAAPPKRVMQEYSLEEVAKHNTENDCWVIVNGQVLDATKFLPDHPGGKKAILLYAGRDATEECKFYSLMFTSSQHVAQTRCC